MQIWNGSCINGGNIMVLNRSRSRKDRQTIDGDFKRAVDAERQMTFLAEAGKALMSTIDYGEVFHSLARLVVPVIADYCVVYSACTNVCTFRKMAATHAESAREGLLKELLLEVVTVSDGSPLAKALHTGAPVLLTGANTHPDTLFMQEPHWNRLTEALQAATSIVVPLNARGKKHGVMIMATGCSGRLYTKAD